MVDELSGAGETSRRTRVLVALAVVAAVLCFAADRWRADRERAALLDAVVAGERVVDRSSFGLRGLRAYVGPLAGNADAPPAARRWAVTALRDEGARWRPRVRSRRAAVLDLPVLAWHGDVAAARDAYAQRLAAWDQLLGGVGRPGRGSGADARAAEDRARTALLHAGADADQVRRLLGAGPTRSGEGGSPPRR